MHMLQHTATRCTVRYLSSSSLSSRVPWFIDSSEASLAQQTSSQKGTLPPLPPGIPAALQTLHAQLAQSPYLEPSKLLVRDPIPQPAGPPLPISASKGRRKRGGTYPGEGLLEPGNLWNWIVLAQVRLALVIPCHVIAYISCRLKKDREARIHRVYCTARPKTVRCRTLSVNGSPYSGIVQLLSMDPPLQLSKKTRKDIHDGWAMVDAGEFAVHVLSAGHEDDTLRTVHCGNHFPPGLPFAWPGRGVVIFKLIEDTVCA